MGTDYSVPPAKSRISIKPFPRTERSGPILRNLFRSTKNPYRRSPFAIIHAVAIRGIILVFFCALTRAQTPDDAAATLAKSIATHLAPNEAAHLTTRNFSTLTQPVVTKAAAAIDGALRKRVRNPARIEVTLTFSENAQEYLMIAEIHHETDRAVEMTAFHLDPAAPAPRTGFAIEKKMIWEQDAPILDVALVNDQLLILDTNGLDIYERRDANWIRTAIFEIPTNVRDPRGRLEISDATITASLPGKTCRGTWNPLAVTCETGGMFTADRNTIESSAWAPYDSEAQLGDLSLLAETNGLTYIYDATRQPVASFRDWGSDFVKGCAGLLATGPGDQHSDDFIALYDVVNRAPVRLSDPAEFPGPVTALWPGLAIIKNLSTLRYEAYSLTLDCGR
jgi:hypothetical protein